LVLIYQATSTGHRITKNNRLTIPIWAKCLEWVGELPKSVGFRPPSLHVKSCSANSAVPYTVVINL